MKRNLLLTFIFALVFSVASQAQQRDRVPSPYYYTGPVVNPQVSTVQSSLSQFFNEKVRMSHSYSMSFASMGGSYQNINAYTNTLEFFFSPQLYGRVDVSFMHSPFGGSDQLNTNDQLNGQVMIRNAELNYKINDKARIQLRYQRMPYNFGYGYGLGSPFGFSNRNMFERSDYWQ